MTPNHRCALSSGLVGDTTLGFERTLTLTEPDAVETAVRTWLAEMLAQA